MKKKIAFLILLSFLILSGCTPSKSNTAVFKNDNKPEAELNQHPKGLSVIKTDAAAEKKPDDKTKSDEALVPKTDIPEKTENSFSYIKNSSDFYNFIYTSLSSFKSTASVNIINYNEKTYNLEVINKVLKDNPDIDYGFSGASGKVTRTGNETVMEISFKYSFSRDTMLTMKKYSEEKSKAIIASIIKSSMSEFNKVLAIHNYIVNNTSYDISKPIPEESYTDYGVFKFGKAVCEGYAKAMYRLLKTAGIKSYIVEGKANNQAHAWLIVRINGKYTHVDPTWDDPITSNGKNILSYKYFGLSDTQIAGDHSWDKSSYPSCSTTEFNIKK